tara:strand:+ start:2409 stop:2765 length:357 start_codon:yes stop_codon:yes gene_type:complete
MQKIILIITFLLTLNIYSVNAQPTTGWVMKPTQCGNADVVIEGLKSAGEDPFVWMNGRSMSVEGIFLDTRFVLAMNTKTLDWTLLEFTRDNKFACVLGSGNGTINMNTEINKKKGVDL